MSIDQLDEELYKLAEKIRAECWKIHLRLSEPYDSHHDQMKDMQLSGNLASAAISVEAARNFLHKAERKS